MRKTNTDKKRYVICAHRDWGIRLFKEKISSLPYHFDLISNKNELNINHLKKNKPDMIFFLDWSWIVKEDIFTQYKCVVFHSSPLPKFRGGSPIQNQIVRGIKQSKLTAFYMSKGIDTGDILLQKNLNLDGHLRDILKRISDLIYTMIKEIIKGKYAIRKQKGKVSYFKRRKPEESELKKHAFNKPLTFIYNFIRMLEDPYPNAFIRLGDKKIILKEAEYSANQNKLYVLAEIVKIRGQG
jgi:methionyl-tRNA formyltransferase